MDMKIWNTISPKAVKNVVELFRDDWLALAAGNRESYNAMTVSWGQMGELWNKPVATAYVRDSRYTKEFMDRHDYFTLSAFPEMYREALNYIGKHSGRNSDKIAACDLHVDFTECGQPMFEEAELVLVCRKLYAHRMTLEEIDESMHVHYGTGDLHTMYVGEIVNVWQRI